MYNNWMCETADSGLVGTDFDPKSISQPYRCYAKPYAGSGPFEYLAGYARVRAK
jgi:hypothetical protein